MVDIELDNRVDFCRLEKVDNCNIAGSCCFSSPLSNFDHCLLDHLRHIKVPFDIGSLCNVCEVCCGLFVHLSHANSFQDIVQKKG